MCFCLSCVAVLLCLRFIALRVPCRFFSLYLFCRVCQLLLLCLLSLFAHRPAFRSRIHPNVKVPKLAVRLILNRFFKFTARGGQPSGRGRSPPSPRSCRRRGGCAPRLGQIVTVIIYVIHIYIYIYRERERDTIHTYIYIYIHIYIYIYIYPGSDVG